jgi:hypothetical protein
MSAMVTIHPAAVKMRGPLKRGYQGVLVFFASEYSDYTPTLYVASYSRMFDKEERIWNSRGVLEVVSRHV